MKRWLWVVVVLCAWGVVGCAPAAQTPAAPPSSQDGEPVRGGVLTKWLGGDPPHLDNQQGSTYQTNEPVHPAYNTLIRFEPDDPTATKIEPSLAESWEVSPDGKAITFHLRKGVRFHEGGTWDARDAKFNLERMKDPPKGVVMPRRGAFDPVERVEAPDGYTLRVLLARTSPSFLPRLASGWMVMYDKEWLEAGHDPAKEMNGTGPFKFKEYLRGTSIELVKNESYWKPERPFLDGVKLFIIPDTGTGMAAFRTGQLMVYRPDEPDAERLKQEMGDRVKITKTRRWGGTFIFMSTLRKPFDDLRVRQALSLAIDRQGAVKVSGGGHVSGYMTAGGPWALPPEELAKLPGYGPDPEKNRAEAKRRLAEAGYPNGLEAKLGVRKLAGAEDAAIFAKDQWARVGVNVALEVQETAAGYTNLEQGSYDTYSWGIGGGTPDDPDAVYGEYFICGALRNYSKVCNKELDALFEKQSQTTDGGERKRLVTEMEKLAITQTPVIVVFGSPWIWCMYSYVQGYTPQPNVFDNSHLEGVWLAKH